MVSRLRHIVFLVSALTLLGSVAFAGSSTPNTKVVAKGLQFPEGTIFVGDTLYFTDYATSDVLRLVDGNVRTVWHRDGCGANGLVALADEILVACYDSGEIIRMTNDGKTLETISHDDAGAVFASPNDLATDAKGGVYFTCSGDSSVPGKVYYRSPQGQVKQVANNLGYANGLAVSRDGKLLYLAESNRHRLLTFSIGIDGELSNEVELVDLQTVVTRSGGDVPIAVELCRANVAGMTITRPS
jgi:gluconolactonase